MIDLGGRGGTSGIRGLRGGGSFADLTRGTPASPAEALKRVNPHFYENRRWQINCQRCVWAYEAQRRGYDVEAKPHKDGFDPLPHGDSRYGWKHVIENPSSQTRNVGGRTTQEVLRNMERQMAAWGEGARAIVRVAWEYHNSGHVFNVERINGRNVYYDAQVGITGRSSYHRGGYVDINSYISRAEKGSVQLLRSDKAKFTDLIEEAVQPRKKRRGESR